MADYTLVTAKAGIRLSPKIADTDSKDVTASEAFSTGSTAVLLDAVRVKLAATDGTKHIAAYDSKGNLIAQYSPANGTDISKL